MKWSLMPLVLVPFFAYAAPAIQDRDWRIAITAQGSLSTGERFESQGVATFTSLENTLGSRGGFDAAFRDFKRANPLTVGVWQEAEAFRNYLKECEIDVPADVLAMRIGLNRVFSSQSDTEVHNIFSDLSHRLTFEKKIELASRIGGVLLNGYDNARAGGGQNGGGIVSLRDMINAHQNGGKAGVCRDMAQATAMALKQLGVNDSYVVAYQTARGGHATVLVQDPQNAGKTYNINYNFVTSSEGGSALSHLRQDSTIPSVGTDMRIFSAEGRPLTTLPTHLGIALREISGGRASDADPMATSENQVLGARYRVGNNYSVGAGAAVTPDGDRVVGISGSYESHSEHFPSRMSVTLYNNQRDTNLRGRLNSTGVFMEGEQRVISDPISVRSQAGTVSMNFEGRTNFNMNTSYSSLSGSSNSARTLSTGMDITASAGARTSFTSTNGRTRASVLVEATGGIAKADVRDEGSTTFDLRHISSSAQVSHRLSQNLEGFGAATVVMRPGLGIQSRQEVGVARLNSDGSRTSVVAGHEGSLNDQRLAFVPGSQERLYVEGRHERDNLSVGGGAFCRQLDSGRRDCGLRSTATVKLGNGRRN